MSDDARGSRCEMKLGLRIGSEPGDGAPCDGTPRCHLPPCREGCSGQAGECYDVAECTNTIWLTAVNHLLF